MSQSTQAPSSYQLGQLRREALRFLAAGDFASALRVLSHIVARIPSDLDARMRIADILVQGGARDQAQRVFAAVVFYDLRGGRPLHALVAIQALADLGQPVAQLRQAVAEVYSAGSPHIGRGARLAPPADDTPIDLPDLHRAVTLDRVAQEAADRAADLTTITQLPEQFPPVPLLSQLSREAFARVIETAVVRRLGPGAVVVREGEAGDAFYFVASGEVRVIVGSGATEREIARLREGALFGEMALISIEPRTASVRVAESADVVEFGRTALRAAADELHTVASALERFTHDRLLTNLLATSPLFKPFDEEQRRELARRFDPRPFSPGDELICEGGGGEGLFVVLSGEVEVVKRDGDGEFPLARLGPGRCFGEISLLGDQPAIATVRGTRAGLVLCLPRHFFERLLITAPEIRPFFESLSEANLKATAETLDDDAIEPLL